MDKREAIHWLKQIRCRIDGGDEDHDRKRRTAIDCAVAALTIGSGTIAPEYRRMSPPPVLSLSLPRVGKIYRVIGMLEAMAASSDVITAEELNVAAQLLYEAVTPEVSAEEYMIPVELLSKIPEGE